jgi:hypothetical protein
MRDVAARTNSAPSRSTRARTSKCFSAEDRKLLLSTTGVGACMVQRLEDAGFHSLQQLRALGAQHVVMAMCEWVGDDAWANRRRAIQRVIDQVDRSMARRDEFTI